MALVADGDLKNVEARDLLRRAATTQGDCILTIAAGSGYRLALRNGRLLFASRGRTTDAILAYLRRFEILSAEQLTQVVQQARTAGTPLLLTLFRNGALQHPAAFVRSFVADTVFDLVQEREGAFVASPPTQSLSADFPVALEIEHLLDEIDRRLHEQESAGEWLPPADARITWRTDEAPNGAHAGQIHGALSSGPLTVREISQRVPAETHTLRIALAHMNRLGLVEVDHEPSAATKWPAPEALNGDGFALAPETLGLDDLVLLSSAEARVLREIEAGRTTPDEIAPGFVRPSIPRATLAYLLRIGAITDRPRVEEKRALALGSSSRLGPIALAGAAGIVLLLAWLRFGASPEPIVGPETEAAASQLTLAESKPESDPPPTAETLATGLKALLDGDLEGARTATEGALALAPDDEGLLDLKRRIDDALQERESLAATAESEERSKTRQVDRLIGRALQALDEGAPLDALGHLTAASRLDPTNGEVSRLVQRALREGRQTRQPKPEAVEAANVRRAADEAPKPAPPPSPASTPTESIADAEPVSDRRRDTAQESTIDDTAAETAALETGTLVVNAVPWASVFVDGLEVGITPLRIEIETGIRRVEVRRLGYLSTERSVVLRSGEASVEAFVLTADIGQSDDAEEEESEP